VDSIDSWVRTRPYYEDQLEDVRTIPAREADTRRIALDGRLESALADRGIEAFYHHQADAIEALRDGSNVVIGTPTASGKSLAYTTVAFERAMDHGGRTLYLGPQNALIADQEQTLDSLVRDLGFGSRVSVASYTGRDSDSEKRAIRDRRPTVLLSNPDMLHYALLPHGHRLWEWFFSSLETVVIDELHEYRGVFGSHVSLVLRRLARLCERFGSEPQFVCCSATIGNPIEHASSVTGHSEERFEFVGDDRSERGPREWLCWNPPLASGGEGRRRSSHVETRHLFVDLLEAGLQTLVFTRSRQTAERYAMDSTEALRERGQPELADGVEAYEGALTAERRREIEDGLQSGDIRGVWSTNALELGVDIGSLDAVLLDGYPGTRMNSWQCAGRAGRGSDSSLVVLVAGEDQLDQYVMAHPEELFDGAPEEAIVDPQNDQLRREHVRVAAQENWLSEADVDHFGEGFDDTLKELLESGDVERRETDDGPRYPYDGGGSPAHEMSLRTLGTSSITLLDERDGSTIATLERDDAIRDAHPGAIYHHQGQSFEVLDLDLERDRAELSPTWADYYTRVLTEKRIDVEADLDASKPLGPDSVPVNFAEITLGEQVVGFQRRDGKRGTPLGSESLDLPEQTLETNALYFTVPPALEDRLRAMDGDFDGAIHAAEHAAISLFPTLFLCDRGDIGGLSTPAHPHTGRATIFIYDGYPGGIGLNRRAYEQFETLLERTLSMLEGCDCEAGCPACVQSPQCGNANDPLDKELAVELLSGLLAE